jgi:hypothetical protein
MHHHAQLVTLLILGIVLSAYQFASNETIESNKITLAMIATSLGLACVIGVFSERILIKFVILTAITALLLTGIVFQLQNLTAITDLTSLLQVIIGAIAIAAVFISFSLWLVKGYMLVTGKTMKTMSY